MSITDRIKSLLDNVGGENTNVNENQPKDEGNKMSKKELIELLIKVNEMNPNALVKKHREILAKLKS